MGSVTLHAGTVSHSGTPGSTVGSGALWDDASDSTYVQSNDTEGAGQIYVGFAPLDVLTVPSGATVTAVTVNMRAANVSGTDTPARVSVGVYQGSFPPFGATYAVGVDTFSPTGGWQIETSATPTDFTHAFDTHDFSVWGTGLSALVAALEGGAGIWAYSLSVSGHSGLTVSHRFYELSVTVTWDDGTIDLPCDTWVDLDLSTAVFANPVGDQFGQYVDGVITGLDGNFPQFSFAFDLDPVKRYRVKVTYDPTSPHDGDGNPVTSDRFVTLRDLLPGDEVTVAADSVQIGDGASNTADVCILTIGPGLGNWDDEDFGVAQGYIRLLFQTAGSGAVSAISIRMVCKTVIPWQRLTNRDELRLTGRRSTQGSSRLTGYL